MAGQTQGDRATHSGLRQIKSNRWHVLPRRFRLRRRTRSLHLPRGQRTGSVPTHIRHSQKRRHSRGHKLYRASKLDCDVCKLKAQAARTLLPARSRGIWTKMLATWPARSPQLRNTWRPVAGGRKSRCCRPSRTNPSPYALTPQGAERRERRVPARGDRSKPQTPRPSETNN